MWQYPIYHRSEHFGLEKQTHYLHLNILTFVLLREKFPTTYKYKIPFHTFLNVNLFLNKDPSISLIKKEKLKINEEKRTQNLLLQSFEIDRSDLHPLFLHVSKTSLFETKTMKK